MGEMAAIAICIAPAIGEAQPFIQGKILERGFYFLAQRPWLEIRPPKRQFRHLQTDQPNLLLIIEQQCVAVDDYSRRPILARVNAFAS